MSSPDRVTVIVCVGTYRRNEPLARLLEGVERAAALVAVRARVGVVVVDDNPDGAAEPVVEAVRDRFEAGVGYRHLGRGNISDVRNTGIETALELGADWIAMTDDDCVPVERWLAAYLDAVDATPGPAYTGRCDLQFADGAPAWLTDQPFLDDESPGVPGEVVGSGATNNSFLSGSWLREHPTVRFDPSFGVVGGEDVVFFDRAIDAGMVVRYVDAPVEGHEPAERSTFRYQLERGWWMGNTRYLTRSTTRGLTRLRGVAHGVGLIGRAVAGSIRSTIEQRRPMFRFLAVGVVEGCGVVAAALGLRVRHH